MRSRSLYCLFAGDFIVGVLAIDKDAPGTPNSTIDYKIISVTPTTKNVEFYIQESGAISFKGCFDYEVKYKPRECIIFKYRNNYFVVTCTVHNIL